MNLDDYINKIKNPPKYKQELKFCAMKIGYYQSIPESKEKLIRAVHSHFRSDSFKDIRDVYKNEEDTFWYFQSPTSSGDSCGIVSMAIGNTSGTYDENIDVIPKADFDELYNSYKKIGSQKIANIRILTKKDGWDSINDKYMTIFYDSDGNIFIDKYATDIINSWGEDKLGEALARECIEIDQQNERVRQHNQNQTRRLTR